MHSSPWILDNGDIDHIICNLSSLKDVTYDLILSPVKITNGELVKVEALGKVELSNPLVLEQVLGISKFVSIYYLLVD